MTVHVLGRWQDTNGLPTYDVTSRRPFAPTTRPVPELSPFTLGPVQLWGGHWAANVENAWQYSRRYHEHYPDWLWWVKQGWAKERADRYPLGKGAKPYCSMWGLEELDYIQARKRIYIPLYAQAVRFYKWDVYEQLRRQHESSGVIAILDFDAYDRFKLGYSWDDVVNDPDRKMGHAFVLGMMIEGVL